MFSNKILSSFLITFSIVFFTNTSLAQSIYPYLAFTKHVELKKWMTKYQRTLDEEGILLQKKEYHALSIAAYGILNYQIYKTNQDTVSYNNIIRQYKYFCDTSRVHFIDENKGIGLPYNVNFHDLKAPWYSGMTQGVAISFLLRYYELTKDKTALDKAEQIAYFMLRPQKNGGTIGKTPEGYTFIEEYPNSKVKGQVLNGFINGLIGLKEYLNYFPKDTLAQRIHDESYISMINTFKEYDRPGWTTYSRKGGNLSNHYMRYEIAELEHLYSIYYDEQLTKQMMIWSYFAYNKFDTNSQHYFYPNYQFAIPLKRDKISLSNSYVNFGDSYHIDDKVRYKRKKNRSNNIIKKGKEHTIFFSDSTKSVIIYTNTNKIPKKLVVKINSKKVHFDSLNLKVDKNKIYITNESSFKQVKLKFNSSFIKKIKVDSVSYLTDDDCKISKFGFYKIEQIKELTKNKKYELDANVFNASQGQLFYRYSDNKNDLNRTKYTLFNTSDISDAYFSPPETGFYEFFISTNMIPNVRIIEPTFKLIED